MTNDIMGMFPDDFPFDRSANAPTAEDRAPVVEAQPLTAGAFPDDFPFNRTGSSTSAPAPAGAPAADEQQARPVATLSIFPAGFPFVEAAPELEHRVHPHAAPAMEAVPEALPELTAAEQEALAPLAVPAAPAASAPGAPLPFKDRRRSPRQQMRARATLRVDSIAGNPLRVEVENLSLLGVRIRADRELLLDDRANLRLEVGPLKWATRLRVINCLRRDEASYTIGCEFVGNELARGRAAA